MDENSSAVLDGFLLKLGSVLTMTKDALLEDFLGDLPKYVPDFSSSPTAPQTYEQFKAELSSSTDKLSMFVECLVKRLGYDISSFEKNEELVSLVSSIFAAIDSLGASISSIASKGSCDWKDFAEDLMKKSQGEDGSKLTTDELFNTSFVKGSSGVKLSSGGTNAEISIGNINGTELQPIVDCIGKLVTLIKKFRDFEWGSIRQEYKDFAEFIDDSYFNEKFAERLFDHFLIVLLSKARKVFDEEIMTIANSIESAKEIVREELGNAAEEVLKSITDFRKELEAIEKILRKKAQSLYEEAKNAAIKAGKEFLDTLEDYYEKASGELYSQYKIVRQQILDLTKQAMGYYGKLGDTLDKLYKILDFIGILSTKEIEIAKYVPADRRIPELDISEVDKLLDTAFQKDLDDATAFANKTISNALSSVQNQLPKSIEINIIDYSKVQQLFKHPESFLSGQFPLKNYDDAEALLAKIYSLAKAFDVDVPDFSSIGSILNEIYCRIKKELDPLLKKAGKDLSTAEKDIKSALEKVEEFILDLKKVLETFAIEIKNELSSAFKQFEKESKESVDGAVSDAKSLFSSLQDSLASSVHEAINQAQKNGRHLIEGTNIKIRNVKSIPVDVNGLLYRTFAEPLSKSVKESLEKSGLFDDIGKLENDLDTLFTSNNGEWAKEALTQYRVVLEQIHNRIVKVFDGNEWEKKFASVEKALKEEFDKQTASIPDSIDELKSFGNEALTSILEGKSLKNPFSGFDFTAYFTIVSDTVKDAIPTNLDVYYYKFRDITRNSVISLAGQGTKFYDNLASAAKDTKAFAAEYSSRIDDIATDIFTSCWKNLKDSVSKLVVTPVLTMIEKTIKQWMKEVIDIVIDKVIDTIQENVNGLLNYTDYQELFDEAEDTANKAVDLYKEADKVVEEASSKASKVISDILMLSSEAREIDSWQDGLSFAIKVYKVIPDTVKEYVSGLIKLPKWNFDQIHLPDYKLDIKNKILATTLFEYETEKKNGEGIEASVAFQVLFIVGDRKMRDDSGNILKDEDGDDLVRSGLYILPVLSGTYNQAFNLGKTHTLSIDALASINNSLDKKSENIKSIQSSLEDGTIGFFVTAEKERPWKMDAEVLSDKSALNAYLELLFKRGQAGKKDVEKLEIYSSDVLSISIEDYPQKAYVGYGKDGFDVGYVAEAKNLEFILSLKNVNGFFDKLFSDDITFSVDKLNLGYTYKGGLQFNGNARARIPIEKNLDLKFAKMDNLAIELSLPEFRGLSFSISTNISANLQCVNFTLCDVGYGLDLQLLTDDYRLGEFDISPTLKLPDGIGISINISDVIIGAGALNWNKKTGNIIGAFELSILDKIGANTFFILDTSPSDGSNYSFMGILFAEFKSGLPLGMGFSLTGIGGSLGLNRRIDTTKMRDAVIDGSLMSVLFVKDLDKHLNEVIANATQYFPQKKEQYFFGALAQLTWGELFVSEFGMFIQAPNPVEIVIAGGFHLRITDSVDKLMSLNVNFLGSINFSTGMSFDAELVDSHIVGIELYGSAALRIRWGGGTKGFILSAGGFHPKYTPDAGFNVRDMKRIGMKLDYSILKISLESYFAVTSNTVQFGSDLRLQIGWKEFGISGFMYFNVLFQFKPFAFMFDASVGVAVKLGSWTVTTISLALDVSGPAKWHVKGKASFQVLLIKVEISFSESWGKSQSISGKKYVTLLSMLCENHENNRNWTIINGDIVDNLVTLAAYEGDGLILNPFDTLSFSQDTIPWNVDIEKYGESFPGDINRIELEDVRFASGNVTADSSVIKSSFAPSLIHQMSDEEKLASPSYVDMDAGYTIKANQDLSKNCDIVQSDLESIDLTPEALTVPDYSKRLADYEKVNGAQTTTGACSSIGKYKKLVNKKGLTSSSVKQNVNTSSKYCTRPSSRRTSAGFNRYLREVDNNMNVNLDGLISGLDK